MVAYDDGSNTDYAEGGGAGIPLMHSAPLHQVGSYKGGPYSEGCYAREVTTGEYMSWYVFRAISICSLESNQSDWNSH